MRRARGRATYAKAAVAIGVWLVLMTFPLAVVELPYLIRAATLALGVSAALTGGLLVILDRIMKD